MKEVIGNFRILGKIGEGGMGTVFHGRDLMLERDVAIKSLRPELASNDEIVERFRIEAIALARLQHHNIANVFSFFAEDGQYYMVMEYVDGESLGQLTARRGALPWREAAGLIVQALRGLEHAHRAGVIHRDIKPANMMVAVDGSLKLMDFGIARILEKMRLTRSGHLIGTLEYMSPEQVQGRDVDARSDLYSLAVVLFELLTGRVPFSKGTDFEIMKAQIEEQPPPLHRFAAGLPAALEDILGRALAKDPARRYPDADAFRIALEKVLADAGPIAQAASAAPATRLITTPDQIPADARDSAADPAVVAVSATGVGSALAGASEPPFWRRYPGIVALVLALFVVGGLAWWSGRGKSSVPAPEGPGGVVQKPEASPPALATPSSQPPLATPTPAAATVATPLGSDPVRPASASLSGSPEGSLPAAPDAGGAGTLPAPQAKPAALARPADAGRDRLAVRSSPGPAEKPAARSRAKDEQMPQTTVRSDPSPPVVRREEAASGGGWTIRK